MDTSSLVAEAADSLAMAMIASSNAPVLLLDDELTIIAASDSFCATFEIDPSLRDGCPLGELGGGEWNAPPARLAAQGHRFGSCGHQLL